jgi:hypothetical protein
MINLITEVKDLKIDKGEGIIKIRRTFNEIELTSEDVLEAIETLSNEERAKLFEKIYNKYQIKKEY